MSTDEPLTPARARRMRRLHKPPEQIPGLMKECIGADDLCLRAIRHCPAYCNVCGWVKPKEER
jgi:hypothetical protein